MKTATKKVPWYVTVKPDEKNYAAYDFANSAQQAKDILEALKDGFPVAYKSKSQGGLYTIFVKKGSVLWS